MKKPTRKCERCGERFSPQTRGRPQRFCSASCRQATYFERRITIERDPNALVANALKHAQALEARDLNTTLVRGVIRQEIWHIFQQIGLVDDPKPPDPKDPPRRIIQEMLKRAGLGDWLEPPPGGPDRR